MGKNKYHLVLRVDSIKTDYPFVQVDSFLVEHLLRVNQNHIISNGKIISTNITKDTLGVQIILLAKKLVMQTDGLMQDFDIISFGQYPEKSATLKSAYTDEISYDEIKLLRDTTIEAESYKYYSVLSKGSSGEDSVVTHFYWKADPSLRTIFSANSKNPHNLVGCGYAIVDLKTASTVEIRVANITQLNKGEQEFYNGALKRIRDAFN